MRIMIFLNGVHVHLLNFLHKKKLLMQPNHEKNVITCNFYFVVFKFRLLKNAAPNAVNCTYTFI